MAEKTAFEKFREHVQNSKLSKAEKEKLITKYPQEKFKLSKALRDLRDLERLKELGLRITKISGFKKFNPKGRFVRVPAKTLLYYKRHVGVTGKRLRINPKILAGLWVGGKVATLVGAGIFAEGFVSKNFLTKAIGFGVANLWITAEAYLALFGGKTYLMRKGMLKPKKRRPKTHRK